MTTTPRRSPAEIGDSSILGSASNSPAPIGLTDIQDRCFKAFGKVGGYPDHGLSEASFYFGTANLAVLVLVLIADGNRRSKGHLKRLGQLLAGLPGRIATSSVRVLSDLITTSTVPVFPGTARG